MKIKKRRKPNRYRGGQTAKRGRRSRTRGSGSQGGVGMAGTGKRGDQKKTLVIKLTGGNNYFGKDKTLRRGNIAKKLDVINLSDIEKRYGSQSGVIDLTGYKILSDGDIKTKLKIKASAASQSALDKVKKAGGEISIKNLEEKEDKVKKAETKV